MAGKWTAADIPDQSGRVAVVTGANSGLGSSTARELARAGATVVIACRNADKGERGRVGRDRRAEVAVEQLDLADLDLGARVRRRGCREHERLDLLVNNAGVMAPPRRLTADGFESQLGTNHLGHFALTGLLLPTLLAAPAPRVVTLSSGAHRIGTDQVRRPPGRAPLQQLARLRAVEARQPAVLLRAPAARDARPARS